MKYKIEELPNGDLILFKNDAVMIVETVTKAIYDKRLNVYTIKRGHNDLVLSKESAKEALKLMGENLWFLIS